MRCSICLDILRDSSEETCGAFLKTLDANQVETIYVDPVDSLFSAVNQYFPMASIVVTDEAIKRYARNAMLDIIHSDGKRFPVVHKDRRLTVLHKAGLLILHFNPVKDPVKENESSSCSAVLYIHICLQLE